MNRYTVELASLLPGEPPLVATRRSSPGERKVKAVDSARERDYMRGGEGRGGEGRGGEGRGGEGRGGEGRGG